MLFTFRWNKVKAKPSSEYFGFEYPHLMEEFQAKLSARRKHEGCDLLFTTLVGKVQSLCCVLFT